MKIGVLEWNIAALGGRQRTMLCFADYFIELRHEVRVYSDFFDEDGQTYGYTSETFLDWYNFGHLKYEHLVWTNLQRTYGSAAEIPREWGGLDVLLVPYGGYGYLQSMLPNTRVITWVIHPEQRRHMEVQEIWTNSRTTRERLLSSREWERSDPKVVIPPHSYKIFRDAALPWNERVYDLICIGSMLYAKGLVEFTDMCHKGGYRGIILSSTWDAARSENARVEREITDHGAVRVSEPAGHTVEYMTNVPASKVAAIIGSARVGVSFSRVESCPLTMYEYLNSGCGIAARGVGAIEEQVGPSGHYFSHDAIAPDAVGTALQFPDDPRGMQRGLEFDRETVGPVVQALLCGEVGS